MKALKVNSYDLYEKSLLKCYFFKKNLKNNLYILRMKIGLLFPKKFACPT